MIILVYLLTMISIASARFRHRQHRQHHNGKALRARIRQNQRYHALLQYLDRKEKIVNARTDFDIALNYPQYSRHDSYHDENAPRGRIHPKRRDNDENYVYAKAQQEFHDVAMDYAEMGGFGPEIEATSNLLPYTHDVPGAGSRLQVYHMKRFPPPHAPLTSAITRAFDDYARPITAKLAELKTTAPAATDTAAVVEALEGVEKLFEFYVQYLYKWTGRRQDKYRWPKDGEGAPQWKELEIKILALLVDVVRDVKDIGSKIHVNLFNNDDVSKKFATMTNILLYYISNYYQNIGALTDKLSEVFNGESQDAHYLSLLPLHGYPRYTVVYYVPRATAKPNTPTILLGGRNHRGRPALRLAAADILAQRWVSRVTPIATYYTQDVKDDQGTHTILEAFVMNEPIQVPTPGFFPFDITSAQKIVDKFHELFDGARVEWLQVGSEFKTILRDEVINKDAILLRLRRLAPMETSFHVFGDSDEPASPLLSEADVTSKVIDILKKTEELLADILPRLFDPKKTGYSKEAEYILPIKRYSKHMKKLTQQQELITGIEQYLLGWLPEFLQRINHIKGMYHRAGRQLDLFNVDEVNKSFAAIVNLLVYFVSHHYKNIDNLINYLLNVFNHQAWIGPSTRNMHYLWTGNTQKPPTSGHASYTAVYHVPKSQGKEVNILLGKILPNGKADVAWAKNQFPGLP